MSTDNKLHSISSLLNQESHSIPTPTSSPPAGGRILSTHLYNTFTVNISDHQQEPTNNNNKKSSSSNRMKLTKSFRCDQCFQTFSRLNNLKSHRTTHTSERPFQCNQCHQDFRRQHDLKRHQKLHTGERPFSCATCHRSFARLDALNRHQRVEGGSACQPKQRRPTIPDIHIPHPASTKHHDSLLILPWSPSTRTLPSPYASPPLTSSPHSPSLGSPKEPDFWKSEYHQLKKAMIALQDETQALKSAYHDLKIENKVLTSLLLSKQKETSSSSS
ncbi:uncharacterized protein BX664DRAFT_333053 [Halteromyces radiatus]|uniref:uncharacterized protein n=1 Tax=Halteromyces radiatus TaxID=101107 RepID=UPI002220FC02|nr:uncharacterized protein BX664DRAFT_333053 [Halteromyces radiatus]KAI8089454.1 hypothetical protein BX664DRAFT_333053 [Halteromyces radiatus]